MKLFSWAHRKLLPSTSLHKNQHNADRLFEISPPSLAPGCERGVKAAGARRDTHADVLTIGTLGMGNLLSRAEEEEEEEEEEAEEEEVHIVNSPSPNRQSMSSNRASTSSNHASTSSNRASISSNRESVSSVDIQKLQEELQKILYFKVGQEQKGENKANAALEKSKGKAKKQRKDRQASGCYINDMNAKQMGNADGKAHVPSERGALPLHSFLEMPMDSMSSNATRAPYKLLGKAHYLLLMQSLKSKLLHYTSPTRVKLSPSLFEKLLEPKVKRDLQHGSTMDKMLHLLRKVMNKRPHGRWKNDQEGNNYEEDKPKFIHEEEEEERLKWAVAKSCRGSDRFIHYITSTLAQTEKDKNSLVHDHQQLHHYQYQFHFQEGGSLQLKLATSPSLDNECWIKTDDEYLVLEL